MVDPKTVLSQGLAPSPARTAAQVKSPVVSGGPSFKDFLKAAAAPVAAPAQLAFSQHAARRLQQRGISFSSEQMALLDGALSRARAKGSRESLFLTRDAALVVGVKQGVVITAMDRKEMKDAVITNIDATVVVE